LNRLEWTRHAAPLRNISDSRPGKPSREFRRQTIKSTECEKPTSVVNIDQFDQEPGLLLEDPVHFVQIAYFPPFIDGNSSLTIVIAAGPTSTTKIAGKMNSTSGKISFTAVLAAFSSAIWLRRVRIESLCTRRA
jgi:hypothetical protein